MIILGIETSCDETAASVIETKNGLVKPLSNIVSSQVKLHSKWGGVVPNLAAREHLKNILPVIQESLGVARIKSSEIDLIAITNGPGLIPALLVGTSAAKALSYLWQKPLLGIHHIEGHIYANFISDKIGANSKFQKSKIHLPVLCLVVSGGHTQLVLMKGHLKYEIVGQTLDDAAGEAFDKVARILGLGYPGGPAVAAEAAKYQQSDIKNKTSRYYLPRPMIDSKNFNFSFSGLKTAVLYTIKKDPSILKNKDATAALCAEFQQATIDVLIAKTVKAARKYRPKTVMLAGGVSANKELRFQLGEAVKNDLPKTGYQVPDMEYSVDNAAMIAAAGFFRWQNMSGAGRQKTLRNWEKIEADANARLENL